MITIALYITIAMVVLATVLNVYRLIKGPDAPDRVLALDTLYINAIALIVLLGITLGTRLYLESALLIAVMGFVGTVAMAKYLKRGSVID
ncbi:K+/H+ antiporter subunit F [Marinobacter sp.]|jgi:multicomponent K+:H+ antiporter subunit F|uniref:Cation:proton antiporter n=1 Tax=Marinobacter salarius TaxID=1420917 RepID=W5YV88_9GAMM|nr:K+/H+ antiporter subunit F [Marinobacter sp.]AHI30363.1 cation:proton antiporter [Marinobacter salarius]MBE96574.1 K+/H+ antiporter subunit F [Marinobacter sp.]MBP54686.1 K+/H+ antiporter subunit F [Marinobacter sp.]|tara:strand:- start:417 stop:686 length:270 start_codon:yes stop_codon:yes gene_type:complete